MRFELLKPNKIKVIVENGDLEKWGVTADDMAKNTPQSREIFFKLLKEAEKETGFSCNNARLVVEAAIAAGSDELTLFVTKVDSEDERALFDKISTSIKAENKKEQKKTPDKKTEESTMIELVDFEDVIKMCNTMRECFWGSLYSYREKYYMTMLRYYIPKASEFGSVCPAGYRVIVEEHGTVLAKNNAFLFIRSKFDR